MNAPGLRIKLLGFASLLASLAFMLGGHKAAEASDQIYTLPFEGQYSVSCWYQWYSDPPCNYPSPNFHYGTDYVLGAPLEGGHPIHAAARGTALPCAYDSQRGYAVVVDHGSGRVTRYLHFMNYALPANGQIVARGQTIGYEGATGNVTGPHLHFETREGATRTCSSSNGTAVDPYGGAYSPGTYSWKTNPPSAARDLDFSGDGYPDVLAKETSTGTICLVRGNGIGGWNGNGDPGCGDGSPIGFGWNVFDLIFRPGDFNGDGYSDVLARNPSYSGGTLCLIAGYRGDGPPPDYWIEDPPDPACGVGTPIGFDWNVYDMIIGPGDFSGDGFADLLARENWGNRDLCLVRGDGHGDWIRDPGGECGDGTKIGWGWGIYNSLVAPSDWAGNGDSCPDVFARQSASPYWVKYHSGNCGLGGQYFKETSGVNIETAWSGFDWLLSVGDFGGVVGAPGDICSDVLRWYGGKHYLDYRRGNCEGGFIGVGQVVGYEWQVYDWLF